MVESTVGIYMSTNRIWVKCNEQNVVEFLRDKLEASLGWSTANSFLIEYNSIFKEYQWLVERCPEVVVHRVESGSIYLGRIKDEVAYDAHLWVVGISLYPFFMQR